MRKGIITGLEARKLINDTSGSVIATIEAKVTTEELTKTETIETTEVKYHTAKQKSFKFISGDPNTYDGYKEQSDE